MLWDTTGLCRAVRPYATGFGPCLAPPRRNGRCPREDEHLNPAAGRKTPPGEDGSVAERSKALDC